jgi:hypothetical protein
MRKLLLAVLTVAVTAVVTGCGKSHEEKVTDEYNALVAEVNGYGVPSSSWSDEDLNRYDAALSRLEALHSEVQGGYGNEYLFEVKRRQLQEARYEKSQAKTRAERSSQLSNAKAKALAASEEYDRVISEFSSMRAPDTTSSVAELRAFLTKLDKIDEARIKLRSATAEAGMSSYELSNILDTNENACKKMRGAILQMLETAETKAAA